MKIICKVVNLRKRINIPAKVARNYGLKVFNTDWQTYEGQVDEDPDFEYAKFLRIETVPKNKEDYNPTILAEQRIIDVPQAGHSQYIHFDKASYIYVQDMKRVFLLNPITKI